MDKPIHIAITRRVRKTHVEEFERALTDFASRSLAEPGARGVHCLYPPPGSGSTEYGIMRSFANPGDRAPFTRRRFTRNGWPASSPWLKAKPPTGKVLAAGLIAAGIVVILTWVAMPLLVKIAQGWLYPKNKVSQYS
jgi:uncharacterized protein